MLFLDVEKESLQSYDSEPASKSRAFTCIAMLVSWSSPLALAISTASVWDFYSSNPWLMCFYKSTLKECTWDCTLGIRVYSITLIVFPVTMLMSQMQVLIKIIINKCCILSAHDTL